MPRERNLEREIEALLAYQENPDPVAVGKKLGLSTPSIYRFLYIGRKAGSIRTSIDIAASLYDVGENRQLGRELEKSYRSLNRAYVYELPPSLSGGKGYDFKRDAILHRVLGAAAAWGFSNGVIRPEDSVGFGGGRAMRGFAESFRGRLELHPNLHFYSLAGGTPDDALLPPHDSIASADQVAFSLVAALRVRNAAHLMYSPPYFHEPWRNPSKKALDIAVFELEAVRLEDPQSLLGLRAFASIDSFAEFSTQLSSLAGNIPILQLLNRFIVLDQDLPDPLRDLTDQVNQYAVGPAEDFIRSIPVRMVIAGGIQKVPHILYALENGLVSHLFTDSTTAKSLIKLNPQV